MTTRTADIVIVIIGTACAWRLAESGLNVLVVEQGNPASGSTGRSAPGVRAHFTAETNILLSHHSIQE